MVFYYLEHPEICPKGHKKRSEYYYDKQNEYKKMNLNDWVYWDYAYRKKAIYLGSIYFIGKCQRRALPEARHRNSKPH